jgi:hypothetical protein
VTIEAKHRRLTVLHVATVNKPINSGFDYAPIETIIHHIHQGIQSLGHRSIVACSADSRVSGEQYVTVGRSLGDYCGQDTPIPLSPQILEDLFRKSIRGELAAA